MTGPVTLHAEAPAELEAALWYDEQRDGLGVQFLAAVDRTIQHAVAWPRSGVTVEGLSADLLVRRVPVSAFPYHGHSWKLAIPLDASVTTAHDRSCMGW